MCTRFCKWKSCSVLLGSAALPSVSLGTPLSMSLDAFCWRKCIEHAISIFQDCFKLLYLRVFIIETFILIKWCVPMSILWEVAAVTYAPTKKKGRSYSCFWQASSDIFWKSSMMSEMFCLLIGTSGVSVMFKPSKISSQSLGRRAMMLSTSTVQLVGLCGTEGSLGSLQGKEEEMHIYCTTWCTVQLVCDLWPSNDPYKITALKMHVAASQCQMDVKLAAQHIIHPHTR